MAAKFAVILRPRPCRTEIKVDANQCEKVLKERLDKGAFAPSRSRCRTVARVWAFRRNAATAAKVIEAVRDGLKQPEAPCLSLNPPSVQYCTDICRREFYSYRIELHLRIVFFAYA